MEKMKVSVFVILIMMLSASGVSAGDAASREIKSVSSILDYPGSTSPEYEGYTKQSEYVEMSDGVKLAVDIFIPADGPPRNAFPVVMEYTPYTRAFIDLKDGPIRRSMRKIVTKSPSPVLDPMSLPEEFNPIKVLLSHGYVFVRADMRGSGASYGWKADFMPKLAEDGGELVDWIAEQVWCDGNIGMMGGSYTGYSQIVTAGHAGPALKCIMPMMVPLQGYDGEVYPGGIYLHGFMTAYSDGLTKLNLNYYKFNIPKLVFSYILDKDLDFMLPAAPVVDEDGDGELIDEVPLDLNRNGSFLDDYLYPADPNDEPRYKDGQPREHVYYLANYDHKRNMDYHTWAQWMFFTDYNAPPPLDMYSVYDFCPSHHVPRIMETGIAVMNVGGWFDTFVKGTTEYYSTMKDTNPSKMLIVPGFHGGGGPYWEYMGEDIKGLMKNAAPLLLRFFDRYLKGIDNGIDKEPPILIYVMNGGGFRFEDEWPLERQTETDYFFNKENGLSISQGAEGNDKYVADFTHDARWGNSRGNRWLATMGVAPDKLPVRNKLDKKCLTYTTAPLRKDMEVTGHPIVRFWVSSSADDTDFFVYLSDIDEKGQVVQVTEGVLRAGFAGLVSNDQIIDSGDSGIDVKPELPWHGFEEHQYDPEVFSGGKTVELVIGFRPTSWIFREGHQIRVSIACADWPTFRLHPKLSMFNDPNDPANIIPIVTVLRDSEHPSRITLPVIPE